MLNIGLCIKEEMLKQERTMSWLARKLNRDRSAVYRMLNKNSIDTNTLADIARLLNRDFFWSESTKLDTTLIVHMTLNGLFAKWVMFIQHNTRGGRKRHIQILPYGTGINKSNHHAILLWHLASAILAGIWPSIPWKIPKYARNPTKTHFFYEF